jgi:hypothetical protein
VPTWIIVPAGWRSASFLVVGRSISVIVTLKLSLVPAILVPPAERAESVTFLGSVGVPELSTTAVACAAPAPRMRAT